MVEVNPNESYSLLGMSLEGRGLFIRERKLGLDIGSKKLNQIVSGEFIYSRLFAWKGAFDFVRDEFEGMYVSAEYPTFVVDEERADVRYLHYYFNQAKVWKEVEEYCVGVTKASRNRFKEKYFMNLMIPLPPLSEQKLVVSKIESIKVRVEEIRNVRKEQERELQILAYSKYLELIENAEWKPMREIAPIVRRDVAIDVNEEYPELGIRSFGKGTFHKPPLSGLEVGSKTLYQIAEGDLMFSNVFAWEGAIAVAKKEDDGRYGSHRFISCIVNAETVRAEFLCFHFLTPKGLEVINVASPGGAGRNKTLGLEKLMKIEVPVPSISKQIEFVALLGNLNEVKIKASEIDKEFNRLMPSILDKAFKGEL